MEPGHLKEYIIENSKIIEIVEALGCGHIRDKGKYISCSNPDGDNPSAITIYKNEYLTTINYTRDITTNGCAADIFSLVGFVKQCSFPEALKFVCEVVELDYYHDFDEELPESIRLTKLILDMQGADLDSEQGVKVAPISEQILGYYKPWVNDLFYNDGISYETQMLFEIGYDEESNRISIPIRDEIGTLVGVKGRHIITKPPDGELKYLYLEPTSRSQILYGLHVTHNSIKKHNRVFVFEAEKGVLQAFSYGCTNAVATGGKKVSKRQIEILTRLGVDVVFAFDKDVSKEELQEIANRFVDGVNVYAILDKENMLGDKESPSDNSEKFQKLVDLHIYKLKQ